MPAVIQALKDPDLDVRRSAANALRNLGNHAATSSLLVALREASISNGRDVAEGATNPRTSNKIVRGAIITALGKIGDWATREVLQQCLEDADELNRAAAATALGQLGDRRAVPRLILALNNDSPHVRSSAANALGLLGDRLAVPALIQALKREPRIPTTPSKSMEAGRSIHDAVRGSIITALGRIGDTDARESLESFLSDNDAAAAGAAAHALGLLGDRAGVPALIESLQSKFPEVGSSSANALGLLGDRSAVPALVRALKSDYSNVRGSAATALGILGDHSVVSELSTLLEDAAPSVRGSAIAALGKIGNSGASPPIRQLLTEDTDAQVRGVAATALGAIGEADSIATLRAFLKNETTDRARIRAIAALENLRASDVDASIYHIAVVPARTDRPMWNHRIKDRVASRAIKSIARFGAGENAISSLRGIAQDDPSSVNRTEALGGLARLRALDAELVSSVIGSSEDEAVQFDADDSVRGRICFLVFLEFANGHSPDVLNLQAVVRHLTSPKASRLTIQPALAAFDRLAVKDGLRAAGTIDKLLQQANGRISGDFDQRWRRARAKVEFAKQQADALAEMKKSPSQSFAEFVGRHTIAEEREPQRPSDFIVVGARQELDAIRRFLKTSGMRHELHRELADGRPADVIYFTTRGGGVVSAAVMLASEKGNAAMRDLLEAIDIHESPKRVIMVGMMAGLKGRVSLLDVLVPLYVYDGTALGTKDGAFVPEMRAGNVDTRFHDWLQALDIDDLRSEGLKLITHKKTVAVGAKIDDISHALAQSMISVDPENIVGLEMEASAIVSKSMAQSTRGNAVQRLMIKGVADYAGETPSQEEIARLRSLPTIAVHLDNPDPTNNLTLKAALQEEATHRAFRVALRLFEIAPS